MAQENRTPKLNNQDKGDAPRKGPKFSIYWIYAIIAVVLLLAQYIKFAPETTQIGEQEFRQKILLQGDVDHLDLVKNKDLVRVYIKPESIDKPYYVDKFKTTLSKDKVKGVPLFEFEVVDLKGFQDRMAETYKNNPTLQEVPLKPVKEGDWFGPVANTVLSLLIIIGAWILLMRKMGGQGGAGHPFCALIISMHQ